MMRMEVADAIIQLDIPDRFIIGYMPKFMCSDDRRKADITIRMTYERELILPADAIKETNVPVHTLYSVRGSRYCVRTEEDYVTYFRYNESCTDFTINLNGNLDIQSVDQEDVSNLDEEVSSVLRRIFIMILATRNGVCLHSSSIRYLNKAILFSATSGVGKTTHTSMWKSAFPGVEVINGDNGYCLAKEDGAFIYGAPWCGTSGECMNVKVPMSAVVFLEQARENAIRQLSIPEAFMRLSAGCFMPAWDQELMAQAIKTTEALALTVRCYHLKCKPDQEAAKIAKQAIFGE